MKNATATQQFVPLEEVRNGVVILKDGSFRTILMASSINFALKSADEQQAILSSFQSFLNTLDFSIQFYVQSRELNIEPYLALLEEREGAQRNDLMKVQLREYVGFIRSFTNEVDIMTKSFFVIISYTPATLDVGKGVSSLMGSLFSKEKSVSQDSFEEHRSQLEQRVSVVEQGLARIGVRTAVLDTNEVIDLFYHLFNPDDAKRITPHQ